MSRGFQRAFHEHIYIREHTARRHAATQRRRVLAFHGRSSSLSALLAESPAHPHSPTPTPCPEGLTSRQCHPQLPVSRVTACPLVCAVRAHLITSAQQKPFPIAFRSPIVQVPSDGRLHLTLFVARADPAPHTPSWVLDTSTSNALSTFLRLPIRPLGRLNGTIGRTLGKQLLKPVNEASERDAMLWRSWPFPWVAPRACATSARLTAR